MGFRAQKTASVGQKVPNGGRKPPYGEGYYLRPVGARAWGRERPRSSLGNCLRLGRSRRRHFRTPLQFGYVAKRSSSYTLWREHQGSENLGGEPRWDLDTFRGKRALERILEGPFDRARIITWNASPTALLDDLRRHGWKHLEVIIGKKIGKAVLRDEDVEAILRLTSIMEEGTLRIFVPRKGRPDIHSKLIILQNEYTSRLILPSQNEHESRSIQTAMYTTLDTSHPYALRFDSIWEEHMRYCEPYLDDLLELFKGRGTTPMEAILVDYLSAPESGAEEGQPKDYVAVLLDNVLEAVQLKHEMIRLEVPESLRPRIMEAWKDLDPQQRGDEVIIRLDKFVQVHEERYGLPLMSVDLQLKRVVTIWRGQRQTRGLPADEAAIREALQGMEEFFDTAVRYAQSVGSKVEVRAYMFEIILYLFCAPFMHEWFRIYRRWTGVTRGPRPLVVYGETHRGKTILLRYAYNLLVGADIMPLADHHFKAKGLRAIKTSGTTFPVVIDDVDFGRYHQSLNHDFKLWWDEVPPHPIPQLIIATNKVIKDSPTRSRTKWLDINHVISFSRDRTDPQTAEREHRLKRFWGANSHLFDYFVAIYMDELLEMERGDRTPTLDELSLGRRVFRELYRRAGQEVPDWLLDSPVEDVYPAIRLELLKYIRLGQAELTEKDGNPVVKFGDVTWDEIDRIVSQLPGVFEPDRRGKTVEIRGESERFYRLIGRRPKRKWLPFGR